jgi:hypothetical protein
VPGQVTPFVVVAVATLVVPVVFVCLVLFLVLRRRHGREIGRREAALVAFVGGLALGLFAAMAGDVVIEIVFVAALAALARNRWRALRHVEAGWLLVGGAVPVIATFLLGLTPPLVAASPTPLDPAALVAAALALVLGIGLVVRGDPTPPTSDARAVPEMPGSRSPGSIAAAIRGPAFVGPFGIPELAALMAVVVAWIGVPLLLPREIPLPISLVVAGVVGGGLAAEAYLRAMPPQTRRAFEAFSWLGEWEIAVVRRVGDQVPTSPRAAERWLVRHPDAPSDDPDLRAARVEILLLAGRLDEARRVAHSLPVATPEDRFRRLASVDVIDWRSGGPGDLAALEEAAREIEPPDGDPRLRAEVTVAAARVRRRMADGRREPADAAEPLLAVRERLGHRADGQVERVLRRRLFAAFAVSGVGLGLLFAVVGGSIALPG